MMLAEFLNQAFAAGDLAIIGLLIVLEGVLSIDNALVLGLLAKRLPKHLQQRALTYGLVGAFVFRVIAIALAAYLLHWWWVKLLGGGYLIYVALKHFFFESREQELVTSGADGPTIVDRHGRELPPESEHAEIQSRTPVPVAAAGAGARFWWTVLTIELTDIAFAIDSILAAIAMIPATTEVPNPKLWVVVTGGMLGVILMRFAAVIFIKLLERFPRFEVSAYLLVTLIGCKLLADWYFNKPPPNLPPGTAYHGPVDFHSVSHPAFWVFWGLMVICFAIGFIPQSRNGQARVAVQEPA
jgi:YkoY family integral membrane protein